MKPGLSADGDVERCGAIASLSVVAEQRCGSFCRKTHVCYFHYDSKEIGSLFLAPMLSLRLSNGSHRTFDNIYMLKAVTSLSRLLSSFMQEMIVVH